MQYGAGVTIAAPAFGDLYLVQFTLPADVSCGRGKFHFIDTPTGSVAIINPFQPFTKTWLSETRQLFLRIDRDLLEREFRALTDSDETGRIEFDPLPQEHMARAGTLAHLAQMLCDDLKNDSSELLHPPIRGQANAGHQGSSVAAVANSVGFAHLGRFARDYQARFGELPSQTLHRSRVGRSR